MANRMERRASQVAMLVTLASVLTNDGVALFLAFVVSL
jgi:hypothetical protein